MNSQFMGIYTRVSTADQADAGVSLSNQLSKGIEKSKSLGLDYKHYEDAGLSGALPIDQRPGLKQLIEDIQVGKITHLFVYDLDRLSRDVIQYHLIKSIFKEHNLKVYDVNGEINFKDDGSVLLSDLKNLFSSYERTKIRSRIIFNLEENAKKGKWGGGNMLPYGYKRDSNKMLVIEPSEAEIVREIFNLSLSGKGTKVIGNILNDKKIKTRTDKKWRDGTVYGILTNTLYMGQRKYKDLTLEAPAIISSELFKMTQDNLKKNLKFKVETKYFYLLKGLIKCGICGKTFYGHRRADLKDKAYKCISRRYSNETCGNRGIDIDYLNSVVINSVRDLHKHINNFFVWFENNDMINSVMRDLSSWRKKEKEVMKKIDNLMDIASEGDISKDIFNNKIKKLNEELELCKKKKNELLPQLGVLDKKEKILSDISSFTRNIDKMDDHSKQNIIRSFVEAVYVTFIPEKNYHLIVIEYKLDELSEYRLKTDLQVEYKQRGFRLDRTTSNVKLNVRQVGSQVYVNVKSY